MHGTGPVLGIHLGNSCLCFQQIPGALGDRDLLRNLGSLPWQFTLAVFFSSLTTLIMMSFERTYFLEKELIQSLQNYFLDIHFPSFFSA